MRILPILAVTALLATSAAAQSPPLLPPPPSAKPPAAAAPLAVTPPPGDMGFVELLDSRFGLFNAGPDGKSFEPTDTVPFKVGQSYGWFAHLRTNKPTIHVREEVRAPAPAKSWSDKVKLPQGMTIAADHRSAVYERDVTPTSGMIISGWAIAAGDPLGEYVIRATIDGQLRQFNFEIK
ncbi:hypothetical protein [Phenylobacterium sp.]|uniref:hypothetical protein n=1 Tax=Phenylobacterium sp. TaxID=1871053 RepID=UPI0012219C33|nr:hypothetical protein [Phenylobacterium sp.]THD62951.1 MAG: hypothetical protein E8A49_06230 [Phenylobacterium sp.]